MIRREFYWDRSLRASAALPLYVSRLLSPSLFNLPPDAEGVGRQPKPRRVAPSRRVSPFLRQDTQRQQRWEMQWRCNSRILDALKLQCIKKKKRCYMHKWKNWAPGLRRCVSHKIKCHLVLFVASQSNWLKIANFLTVGNSTLTKAM